MACPAPKRWYRTGFKGKLIPYPLPGYARMCYDYPWACEVGETVNVVVQVKSVWYFWNGYNWAFGGSIVEYNHESIIGIPTVYNALVDPGPPYYYAERWIKNVLNLWCLDVTQRNY